MTTGTWRLACSRHCASNSSAAGASTEIVGNVTLNAGSSQINSTAGSSGTTGLTFGTLTRNNGGTISFKGGGRLSTGASPPIPVVGGTGRYDHARGTVVVGPGNAPLNTYRLTLP